MSVSEKKQFCRTGGGSESYGHVRNYKVLLLSLVIYRLHCMGKEPIEKNLRVFTLLLMEFTVPAKRNPSASHRAASTN